MSTLSSANVRDVNLVLKERTHKIKIKYYMHQYSNSYAYFRQLAHSVLRTQQHVRLAFHNDNVHTLFINNTSRAKSS